MTRIDKAGILINAEGEVIGWFEAGESVDMEEGDSIISHHKTAEKAGVLDRFNELKAANKPEKEAKPAKVKVEGEEKVVRTRVPVPTTGDYTVLKADYAKDHSNPACAEIYTLLVNNSDFAVFFENAKTYTHIKRDGTEGGEITPAAVVAYALRRGVIVAA